MFGGLYAPLFNECGMEPEDKICKRCNTHIKVRCKNEAAYKCFICAQKIPLLEFETLEQRPLLFVSETKATIGFRDVLYRGVKIILDDKA